MWLEVDHRFHVSRSALPVSDRHRESAQGPASLALQGGVGLRVRSSLSWRRDALRFLLIPAGGTLKSEVHLEQVHAFPPEGLCVARYVA